jgi:hypothetical protein
MILAYPRDPEAPAEIEMSLDFDTRGIIEMSLATWPAVNTEQWAEAEWNHYNDVAAALWFRIGSRLRLEGVNVLDQEQSWIIDGVAIGVSLETGPSDFRVAYGRAATHGPGPRGVARWSYA